MKVSERVDKKTHVPKSRRVACPSFPDSIKIEITSRCNYKCPCCSTWKNLREQGDMPSLMVYELMGEASTLGVTQVGLFLLGEPLMVKEIPDYIEEAKMMGMKNVFVTTNGSLCDLDVFEDMMNSGLDSLKFSINAGSRESYKKMHGVDMFDTVIENLKEAVRFRDSYKNKKPEISVSTIWDDELKDELLALKRRLSSTVDDFYFLPRYNQGGHVSGLTGNVGRKDNPVPSIPCWVLFNSIRVTWDGWVTACCFDHSEKHKIMDMREYELEEAWRSDKYCELRKAHLENRVEDTPCARCLKS